MKKMIEREKTFSKVFLSMLLLWFFHPAAAAGFSTLEVVDFYTRQPVRGATVMVNNQVAPSDPQNRFTITNPGSLIKVRAPGYLRAEQILTGPPLPAPKVVKLFPVTPKALYLSFYGIGERCLRESALKLIEETELNALVIDVKGDRGMIPYRSAVPMAAEVGAQRIITVRDIHGLLGALKRRGIYTIARIVVFKDHPLANARPQWAVRNSMGEIWRDRENLSWVDPFRKEVWAYNIDIAVEAAQLGFDEIQFDYVRFPDASAPRYSQPNHEENRVQAISGFLEEAKNRLKPYNVFVAADIFGYVCWNPNDTNIGQRLEALSTRVDYLSPMLYPSGFQYGIPGYRNPVAHPHEIVYLTLKKAQERTGLPSIRFRPWLQAFRDYAFDRRHFHGKEIREQINAANKFGSQGWMLWNPGNTYKAHGLNPEDDGVWLTGLVTPPKI
jgi:hypothetical protein